MKNLIRNGIAAATSLVTWLTASLAAQAADLSRVPTYKAIPPVAAWTGCYIGFNVGGGWAQATITDGITGAGLGTVSPAGFVGGGSSAATIRWACSCSASRG